MAPAAHLPLLMAPAVHLLLTAPPEPEAARVDNAQGAGSGEAVHYLHDGISATSTERHAQSHEGAAIQLCHDMTQQPESAGVPCQLLLHVSLLLPALNEVELWMMSQ